jgi:outer membrane protein assembly factor BamB/tRNA A-37 threonylcarbamoyl transferase component Bud32
MALDDRPEDEKSPSIKNAHSDAQGDLSTRRIGDTHQPSLRTRLMGGGSSDRVDGRLVEGAVLQKRYRILGIVGAGGMSTVYKGQDLRFPAVTRLCAVKEMLNIATDPQIRQRNLENFEREASILATLSHPAIPQVYDYFTEGEHSYLVLEFIQGEDLESLLNSMETLPSEAQVVNWALQVCSVLIYLHNREPHPIIFRDIKPSNIMLDERGHLRLVDFGIAKVFEGGEKGTMIGTEGYSPPEQYRGIAGPRGDIYSLGATIHHLLTKQDPRLEPPFSFHERPVRAANPAVSEELTAMLERSLEYDASKRFATAEEMHEALSKLESARRAVPSSAVFRADLDREAGAPEPIWEFACEDEVRSSPTVVNGVVFVGAYDNNLYALNARSGEFLWKYPTEGGIGSSPCVAEGKVLFGSKDYSLYALNARSGRLLWTCPTRGPVYSSPRFQFGHIFFGSDDGNLYAVKIDSGRVAWTFHAEAPIRSSPAIGKEAIYFGDEIESVYAIGAGGQMMWRFRARRGLISSPLLVGEVLYVGSKDDYLYALDVNTGWDVWRHRTNGPIVSSPATDDAAIFFGSADGVVYALGKDNGRLLWQYKTGGQVASSPVYHRGSVYIGSTDGLLYCFDAKTGRLCWRFRTGGPVISSPCAADDVVYCGSCDRYVYALPA